MCTCWIVLVYVCYGVYVHVFGNTHTHQNTLDCALSETQCVRVSNLCVKFAGLSCQTKKHTQIILRKSSLPPTKGRTEKPTQILPTPFVRQRNFTINEELKHIMRHKQVSRNGGSRAVGLFPSAFLFLARRRSVSCVFFVFLRWRDGNLKQLSSSQVCVYGVECMLQLFGILLCTYICIWSRTIKEF